MKLRFQISISFKELKPYSKYFLEKSGAQEQFALFFFTKGNKIKTSYNTQ